MNTSVYRRFGIEFRYPVSWELSEEQTQGWPVSLSVQSPEGGFWSLHLHRASRAPDQLAEQVLRTLRQDYGEIDVSSHQETILSTPVATHDLDFYCLDFVVTARLHTFQQGKYSFVVLFQAEQRDFDRLEPVFQAITTSLVHGTPTAQSN